MRRSVSRLALLIALSLPAVAAASDFVDTRINFTLTWENMLVKPGETNPSVPGLRFDRPNVLGTLFFDNYDTRYTGYENLTHAVIYKKVTGKNLEAEAALVFRFLQLNDVNLSSIDDGSYVKLTYWFDDTRQKKTNISLTTFPLSADRMRLGYSYRLSWGGSPIFFKFNPDLPTTAQVPVNPNPAPGARIQFSSEKVNAWLGFKTSVLLNRNPNINELQAIYGVLGGVAVDPAPFLRLELNGGYFDRGSNPLFYSTQDVSGGKSYRDFPVASGGGSFQISVFNGYMPSTSIDYALYRNDPTSAQRFFLPFNYRPGFNWLIQAEATIVATTLQDPEKVDTTTLQVGYAGDVNIRAQTGHLRLKADISIRSLEFILINQPSLVPYQAFPKGSRANPELFGALGADFNFAKAGLTIGVTLGAVFQPANFTPPQIKSGAGYCPSTGGSSCTSATVVVRGDGSTFSILPDGQNAFPAVGAKLSARYDFLEFFAALLDIYYQYDSNQTILRKDATGAEVRQFSFPHQLGFNLTLQARF